MYQFIKPFFDNKMSIFEGYGAFNSLDRSISNRKGVQLVFIIITFIEIPVSIAISVDPDQTPHSAAFDLGLLGLPRSLYGTLGLNSLITVKPLLKICENN